jgi:hypothetical protein
MDITPIGHQLIQTWNCLAKSIETTIAGWIAFSLKVYNSQIAFGLRSTQTNFGGLRFPLIPATRPATLARPLRAEGCPNRTIHKRVQRAAAQTRRLVGGDPPRLEYANLHCMDPAAIHIEQFHIAKIHFIQRLTDSNRQIAVHSPAPA